MNTPFVDQSADGIINCPICRGVLLKDFIGDKNVCLVSFTMRCPHCQGTHRISVGGGLLKVEFVKNS